MILYFVVLIFRFSSLSSTGKLRHLRICNGRDPVAIMPTSSSKKLWAMLSPASYIAFKLSDQDFIEKETYKHTGIKLKLKREKDGEKSYEIAYSGVSKEEGVDASVVGDTKSSKRLSFRQKEFPGVVNHFGNVYCDNLAGCREELADMNLNEVYLNMAASASGVSAAESGESS